MIARNENVGPVRVPRKPRGAVVAAMVVCVLSAVALARMEPEKKPDAEPQPPTEMPVPPIDQVGEPGEPAPSDATPEEAKPSDGVLPAPTTPPVKENPPVADPARPTMGGPSVGDAATPRLTRRDFSGRIRRLDIFPGEAALEYLKLDRRTEVRVKAILGERIAIMDRLVRDHVELVVKINDARQRGDNATLPTLGRQFRDLATELTSRGSAAEEIISVLNDEQRDAYFQMLNSYWLELREQMIAEAKQRGEETTFRRIIDREVDRIWAGEVKRSYERQVGQRDVDFVAIVGELGLDDATLAKCREEIDSTLAKRPKDKQKLGPDERRDVFSRIYKTLDLAAQAKFTAAVLDLPPVREKTIEELAASLPPPEAKKDAKPAAAQEMKPEAGAEAKPEMKAEPKPQPAPPKGE